MLCSWQINAAAGAQATDTVVFNNELVKPILRSCSDCAVLRIGYIRVLLPATIVAWRLDLVFSPSDDRQGVVLLADSTAATLVAAPVASPTSQWGAYTPFPGTPCTSKFDQSSLRLICSPLPVAAWSATIDLDIYTPNPTVEPCQ